jgi:KDO2-lipid IV(A) lauroyltransferase
MVALVVDVGFGREGAVPVTFFGRETLFPDWPARLARVTGAPVVFGLAARRPRGRYTAHICPPLFADRDAEAEAGTREMTQEIATVLEGFVKRYPSQWYAFREIWPA